LASKKTLRVRKKREKRIRSKITGTQEKPRLSVFRSEKHIYVQAIDDIKAGTLATASTLCKELASKIKGKKKVEVAREVGKLIAERLKAQGIDKVILIGEGSFIMAASRRWLMLPEKMVLNFNFY